MLIELLTLFAWSFLSATILPVVAEPALVAIVGRHDAVALPVLVATLGNYLGACTTYALAMTAAKVLKSKRAVRRMERASEMVRRYGAPALLLSWVPLLGDAIVAAAGIARMPFVSFSAWTVVGKAARYVVVALLVDWSVR